MERWFVHGFIMHKPSFHISSYGVGHLNPRCEGLGPLERGFASLFFTPVFFSRATALAARVRGLRGAFASSPFTLEAFEGFKAAGDESCTTSVVC